MESNHKPGFSKKPGLSATDTLYDVTDETLRGLLAGLLSANWRSLCLFTGRYRWRGYETHTANDTGLEIHLPELTAQQALMLMNNLSRLRQEERKAKIAMYKKVGGHPKTIELLNGWLKDGSVSDLLADPRLDGLLTRQWEDYFLTRLLDRLSEDERAALTRLSIFQTRLGEEELAYAGVDTANTVRWLDLSLLQRQRGEAQPLPPQMAELLHLLPPAERAKGLAQTQAADHYTVHPVVADYLLAQTALDKRVSLHRWAAAFYGQPFVDAARQMVRTGMMATDEQLEAFARSNQGIVGQMVAQTQDMARARRTMDRALDWQHHLFAAGEVDAAAEIAAAVWQALARWGERDRAKGLLRSCIDSLDGGNKAVAQGNLATMLVDEGKLAEALVTHEAAYEVFAALGVKQLMAEVLGNISQIHMRKNDLDAGLVSMEKGLNLFQEIDDEQGQAINLHHLAMLFRLKDDFVTALTRSQAAEALACKLKNDHLLAAMLHEQGIIYN